MGKTYRQPQHTFDDDRQVGRKGKHHTHSNNKKVGGMRIINEPLEDDYFSEDVEISDRIVINKFSDDTF